jgi:CheY-like chemotaxis protein
MPRIVIFEPHPANHKLMYKILAAYGFEVLGFQRESYSPQEVELLEADVVILGYGHGYRPQAFATVDALRTYAPTRMVPIVVCTTAPDLGDRDRFRNWAAVSILRKPFDVNDLLSTVQRALVSSWQGCGS